MPRNLQWLRAALLWPAGISSALAGLMALRFLFRLLIANPANPVVAALLAISRPFLFPWGRFWPPVELPELVVEKAALAAMASYLLLGLFLAFLGTLGWGRERIRPEDKQ